LAFDWAAVFVGVVWGAVAVFGAGVGVGVGVGLGFDSGLGICALTVELKVIPEKTIDAIRGNEQSFVKFFILFLRRRKKFWPAFRRLVFKKSHLRAELKTF
jgi:hypothetical protein